MMIMMVNDDGDTDLTAQGLGPVAGPPHDGRHTLDDELTLGAVLLPGHSRLVTRHTPIPGG